MKLVMHIGNHKSGSTTIQNGLLKYRHKMLGSRVLYPRTALISCAHHELPFSVKGQSTGFITGNNTKSFEYYVDKIFDEAVKACADSVVVSSEVFMTFKNADIKLIRNYLERFDEVKIIAYMRNQVELLESAYKFNVLWEATREIITFSEHIGKNTATDYHEYDKRLEQWLGVHRNTRIVVKNFHDEIREGLLTNFCRELDFDLGTLLKGNEEIVNSSLSRLGTLILRDHNSDSAPYLRENLIKKIRELESKGLIDNRHKLYTTDLFNRTVERYLSSNEKLSSKFGVDLNKTLRDLDISLCIGEKYTEKDMDILAGLQQKRA